MAHPIEEAFAGDLEVAAEMEVGPLGKTPASKGGPDDHHFDDCDRGDHRGARRAPEVSAAELAEAAGIGGSTASKCLASLERDGMAIRHLGGREGGRRVADRWALTGSVVSTKPGADDVAPAADDASASRLHKGELSTLVLDYLKAHVEEPIGPVRSARRSVDLPVRSRTRASASNPRAASAS